MKGRSANAAERCCPHGAGRTSRIPTHLALPIGPLKPKDVLRDPPGGKALCFCWLNSMVFSIVF